MYCEIPYLHDMIVSFIHKNEMARKKEIPKLINGFRVVRDLGNPVKQRAVLAECSVCLIIFESNITNLVKRKSGRCSKCSLKPINDIVNGFKIIKDLKTKLYNGKKRRFVIAECKMCFNHFEVELFSLQAKSRTGCGCGLTALGTKRLRRIYSGMKSRCYNPKDDSYYRYGNRGIEICREWLDDKNAFILWALGNGYKECLSIDRINNNGNYSPSNCKWSTASEQQLNKSEFNIWSTKLSIEDVKYIYLNKSTSGPKLAKKFGVTARTIYLIQKDKTWKSVTKNMQRGQ